MVLFGRYKYGGWMTSPPPFSVSLKNQIFELALLERFKIPDSQYLGHRKIEFFLSNFLDIKNSKTDEQHEMKFIIVNFKNLQFTKFHIFNCS